MEKCWMGGVMVFDEQDKDVYVESAEGRLGWRVQAPGQVEYDQP